MIPPNIVVLFHVVKEPRNFVRVFKYGIVQRDANFSTGNGTKIDVTIS
jgi:hypothetical protein